MQPVITSPALVISICSSRLSLALICSYLKAQIASWEFSLASVSVIVPPNMLNFRAILGF